MTSCPNGLKIMELMAHTRPDSWLSTRGGFGNIFGTKGKKQRSSLFKLIQKRHLSRCFLFKYLTNN